jgi:cytochrome o ubiquinol oxidase subunit 2
MQAESPWQLGVLDPQGPIGAAQRTILLDATVIMLAVIIPVIVLTLLAAWWFRAGNPRAVRWPDWEYSGRIEFVVWSIPALIIMFLGGICWIGSHDLDPRLPIPGERHPIDIEVVSLDWQWLFIYPDQGVASANRLVVPAATPIRFRLTSATVMNSFFVPQLGSQIYTMPHMATQLNLKADQPGTFPGLSANFSGEGFSDMRFDVVALAPENFPHWVETTQAAGGDLDATRYNQLARPTVNAPPATFGRVAPHLFEAIVQGGVTPIAQSASPDMHASSDDIHAGGMQATPMPSSPMPTSMTAN